MTTTLTEVSDLVQERGPAHVEQGWGARRARQNPEEKISMAVYNAQHDFLVGEGKNPANERETVASVLVNQGTTPNVGVQHALAWIKANWQSGPFDITWFTPGGLVNATLHDFRTKNPDLSLAAQIFLFPGRVNTDMQAVSGPEAEEFVEQLDYDFTYAFLSVHAFDLDSGRAHFQYSEELRLQRACARLYAEHKFLFLDASKFNRAGKRGYKLSELLEQAKTVTIYTTSTPDDRSIKERFNALCDQLLSENPEPGRSGTRKIHRPRTLRLKIIGLGGVLNDSEQRVGFLGPDEG
jgi:hypothetical protein